MSTGTHCEIEKKYLIRYPDPAQLQAMPGCEAWEITQIYLEDGEGGLTRRIRKVLCNGETRYYRTFKRRLTDLSCEEDEGEIDLEAFERLHRERDRQRQPILKTRYRIPHRAHVLEFDIYPFWQDRAILEIELTCEDEVPDIPEYVSIIRDVTGEKAYKNRQLARHVPMEKI